jgi:cytochrome c biogenesis protein CcdA
MSSQFFHGYHFLAGITILFSGAVRLILVLLALIRTYYEAVVIYKAGTIVQVTTDGILKTPIPIVNE